MTRALERDADFLRSIVEEGALDAILVVDENGAIVLANEQAEKIFGYPREELLGRPIELLVPEASRETHVKARESLALSQLRRPMGIGLKLTGRRKDGTEVPVEISLSATESNDGQRFVTSVIRDVTEKREEEAARAQAESALRQSEELMRSTFSIAAVGVARIDRATGRFLAVNRKMEEITGYTGEELRTKTYGDITHPEDRSHGESAFLAMAEGRSETYSVEKRYVRKDGRTIWAQLDAAAVRDETGKMVGTVSIVQDISSRKASEQSIRESERQLRLVTDATPIFIAHCDTEFRYKFVNKPYAERFGCAPEDLLGKTMVEVLGEKAWAVLEPHVARVLGGESVDFEHEMTYRTGVTHWMRVSCVPERDSTGRVVGAVAAILNITDRKRAELALRRSEEHFELLSNTVPASIFYIDSDRRLRAVNDAFTRWFGVPREKVLGLTSREFVGERAYATVGPHLERALAGEPVEYVAELAYRLGGTRWVQAFYTPHRDPSGRVIGVIGFSMDISRQKRAELALLEADRRKDDFLAMLGHELRNPLTPVSLSLGLMRRYGPDRPEHERAQGVIERQVQQLTRLVDDLLDVSRVTSGKITLQKERTDVASIVSRAVETSHPVVSARNHRLSVRVSPEVVEIEADSLRLAQALTNLVSNAAKYTAPGGSISLTVGREGANVVFRVRDTGIGLAPDMLEAVFEPFFQVDHSIDRSQGGLGLGLPLVRALVQMHGGTVEAFSEGLGRGSEFVVRIPATTEPGQRTTHVRPAGTIPARRHRILLVDDSRDITDTLSELLGMSGNDVRTASDGASALALASGGFRPEIVFLDIGLPGMDGYETARRLRRLPGLENVVLVALTGYGLPQDRERSRESGFDRHLVKPVEADQIEEVVASLDLRSALGERVAP